MKLSKLIEYVKLHIIYDFKKYVKFVLKFYLKKSFFVSILENDQQIYHVTAEFFGVVNHLIVIKSDHYLSRGNSILSDKHEI